MGRLFLMHLDGNAYSCKFCRTHLGLAADIISKVTSPPLANPLFLCCWSGAMADVTANFIFRFLQSFHSKHGKAYLFNRV
jgi:predicted NAD/FAD-binding protein